MKKNRVIQFSTFLGFSLAFIIGCKDTIFKSENDKVITKQGSEGGGDQSGDAKNADGDLTQDTDAANKGLANSEDGANGGKKIKDDDDAQDDDNSDDGEDKSRNNRRGRPGASGLSALLRPGGDTPLALDWNQDGQFATVYETSKKLVRFDLKGQGNSKEVEWLSPKDVWLALDINKNGIIDDGRELFGSGTVLSGGLPLDIRAKNGFEALRQYDKNDDGRIDMLDSVFKELVIWQDSNSNGKSERHELTLLSDTAVIALSVNYTLPHSVEFLAGSRAYVGWEGQYAVYVQGKTRWHRLSDLVFPETSLIANNH